MGIVQVSNKKVIVWYARDECIIVIRTKIDDNLCMVQLVELTIDYGVIVETILNFIWWYFGSGGIKYD